ncbi:MAG TPA: hypothetical protein VGR19_11990 [Allosphingosinicella sp.]|nr:hypothetical protein [Allosphingosinicella sp.]
MAVYAFFPAAEHLRRPDGIGFVLAEGADEAAARTVAQRLVGGTSIQGFTAALIGPGVQPVAVQGLPVGRPSGTTWPRLTRGGGPLNEA